MKITKHYIEDDINQASAVMEKLAKEMNISKAEVEKLVEKNFDKLSKKKEFNIGKSKEDLEKETSSDEEYIKAALGEGIILMEKIMLASIKETIKLLKNKKGNK